MSRLLGALRAGWRVGLERVHESLDAFAGAPVWALFDLPRLLADALRRGLAIVRGELRYGAGYADRVEKLEARYRLLLTPGDRALFELRLRTNCEWSELAARLSTPARRLDAAAVERRYAEIREQFRAMARHCGFQ